ncbi:formate C-acetyltransferase/glycerol dehydratase family glycyl radical enzyme [Enterococcus hulanensis]|uniref:glycyl radical protein n=1 Tax=Enterococcus hulanensis TaxID=2559929 RepID=UPI001A8DFD9C|nr:formate C-acetyltransferase/glycerol dehydratase family glycyl radical enzyme [Enterococcus hulanensis]MBO0459437.1 formate C-acetyltransferase/glycerol dehydratase family glycyl radical enzyme [Enterococcus hulanensis]
MYGLLSFQPTNEECNFERIEQARDKMYKRVATICPERAEIITESFKRTEGKPIVVRRAKAFADILDQMSIYIEPNMLIIGNQASSNFAAPIFPEYSIKWIIDELDDFDKRSGDSFQITEDTKSRLKKIAPYWEGKTHQEEVLENLAGINFLAEQQNVLHRGGISMSGDGHIIPNYDFVLEEGFKGMANIAQSHLDNDADLTQDQIDYYKAAIISMEAAMNFCNRFASLAQEEASQEKDGNRKAELTTMSEMFASLAKTAPKNFLEAVEMVYLTHLLMMIESNGHSFSFGRFDQYVYPYYEKDIREKNISQEKALEILSHFYIMTNSINKVRPWGHTQYSGGYPLYSNLMLGGMKPDGTDGTNDLSYLGLEAMALTGLPEPNLSVRFFEKTKHEFMKDAAKLIRKGFGMPSIFCDEVCIPAMMTLGLSEEVAREYASMGCVETAIPGRWGHRATGMTYVNFGKIMELVMHNGYDPESDLQLVKLNGKEGPEITYESYDEVYAAWEKLLEYYSKLAIDCDLVCDRSLKYHDADAFASSMVNDCLAKGKTLKNGGSEYDFVSSSNIGPSVVGDSLAAIKKLVFDEKKLTLKELQAALDNNFEGLKGAQIRKLCKNAPKFGNDDDYVDEIVANVYESYLKLLPEFKTDREGKGPIGCTYTMSTSNITSYVPNGFDVGATPDGRLATMPLNEGCSPCLSADKNGPTSVINSVSKLPNKKMAGGQLLNMRFSPDSLEGEDNLEKFSTFMEAGRYKNIFHNQFNIMDSKTLRDAKENPEDYPDLMVRVAGYCALFSTLMPEAQDAIIARTELAL